MANKPEVPICAECGMAVAPQEYHPYAACLMFRGCHNSETVRQNLQHFIANNWQPTPENINALPAPVAQYIHDLIANCDPAGMVAENTLLRDQTKMLDAKIANLNPPELHIVSIATTIHPDNEYPLLYGVATNGVVYRYWHSQRNWAPLPMGVEK